MSKALNRIYREREHYEKEKREAVAAKDKEIQDLTKWKHDAFAARHEQNGRITMFRIQLEAKDKEIAALKGSCTIFKAMLGTEMAQAKQIAALRKTLERVRMWANAYPLKAFPKPDLKKAAEILKAAGMTLDSISADTMRYVISGVKDIVEAALQE